MGLFDSLQNLLGGVTDAMQGHVEGLADNQILQDAQEQITSMSDVASSKAEQGQGAIEDVKNSIGL